MPLKYSLSLIHDVLLWKHRPWGWRYLISFTKGSRTRLGSLLLPRNWEWIFSSFETQVRFPLSLHVYCSISWVFLLISAGGDQTEPKVEAVTVTPWILDLSQIFTVPQKIFRLSLKTDFFSIFFVLFWSSVPKVEIRYLDAKYLQSWCVHVCAVRGTSAVKSDLDQVQEQLMTSWPEGPLDLGRLRRWRNRSQPLN